MIVAWETLAWYNRKSVQICGFKSVIHEPPTIIYGLLDNAFWNTSFISLKCFQWGRNVFREGCWDGSKSHGMRKSHVPAYASDFEMAQNSNHSFFLLFLLELLITCFLPKWLTFLARKFWDGSKFEKKLNWGQNDSLIISKWPFIL